MSLRNRKASTGAPSEFFRYAVESEELLIEVDSLLCNIWETKIIQKTWPRSKLVAYAGVVVKVALVTLNQTEDYKLDLYCGKF